MKKFMNVLLDKFQILNHSIVKTGIKLMFFVMLFFFSMIITIKIADGLNMQKVDNKVITVGQINEKKNVVGITGVLAVRKVDYTELVKSQSETNELARLDKSDKEMDMLAVTEAKEQKAEQDQANIDLAAGLIEAKEQADNRTAARKAAEEQAAQILAQTQAANTATQAATSSAAAATLASIGNNTGGSVTYVLTGYCPCAKCCGKWSDPINPHTASGTRPTSGHTIAADTRIFPFGTQISINGIIYTVEDTGSAIKGNHFDIYFDNHQDAVNFGRRTTTNVFRVN